MISACGSMEPRPSGRTRPRRSPAIPSAAQVGARNATDPNSAQASALTAGLRPQPDRGMGGLHRLGDDALQVALERAEVDLLRAALRSSRGCAARRSGGGRSAGRRTAAREIDRQEQRRHHQRRGRDREVRPTRERREQRLAREHEADVRQRENDGHRYVDQSLRRPGRCRRAGSATPRIRSRSGAVR